MSSQSERFTVHLDDLEVTTAKTYAETKSFVSIGIPIGKTIVANGCFDMIHPGHLSLFGWLDTIAYQRNLRPIIAINSDESVRRLKGPMRPAWPSKARSAFLNHLKWPFTVVIFDEETPARLMETLRPVAVLKGGEYDPNTVVKWCGAEVITVPMLDGWSTSRILGDTR